MPTVLQFRRGTTTQNNNFTGSAGELSIDTTLDTVRVHDGSTAGGFALTANAAVQTLTNKTLTSPVINTGTFGTSILPSSADGAALGSASAEFSDLFLADSSTIQLGNDQDVTLTHIPDTGVRINSTMAIQFNDAAESVASNASRLVLTSNSVAFRLPTADGTSGQALVTDASGNLSFAAAGATVSQDNSTDTAFNLYYAATTSGALTAVKYDGGTLTFNPSSETLACTNITGLSSSAKYADLAERYTADADYEAGTVVELGGTEEVTQTKRPRSVAIAGVVSTDPAYLMNSGLENGVSIALLGRVPCKVVGTINKGDILVSSSTPGHAEAHRDIHNPPSGSAIGKAIENKTDDGLGVIEVLVGRM